MNITEQMTNWLNNASPISKEDNIIVQYGLELIIESLAKIIFILIIGVALGKGIKVFLTLIVFCSLRSQAGGIHAKSNLGCTLFMIFICTFSLIFSLLPPIGKLENSTFFVLAGGIIALYAPITVNIKYFSSHIICFKKRMALFILILCFFASMLFVCFRNIIASTVIMESITLLPFLQSTNLKKVKKRILS